MRISSLVGKAVLCYGIVVAGLSSFAASNDQPLDYVIARYIESMGGRAALEQIKSIRLSGSISYKDGQRHKITVLKKSPNLTRVVVDTGIFRLIQAYDGKVAWYAREAGKSISYSRMEGKMRDAFIRDAPLENILFHPSAENVTIELGEDVRVAMNDCFQVIAKFSNGSKNIYYIDKESYIERRIFDYDSDGNLLSEMVPGAFETFDGVTFAMQIIRLENGEMMSTLNFNELETNVGILDTAFIPPIDLP